MRYIKDLENEYCKTQIYSFNNKYIIKFEAGMFEQVYKVSEFDVAGEEDIEEMLGETFMKNVMKRFTEMQEDFDGIIDSID
jgi:hypothetical protein